LAVKYDTSTNVIEFIPIVIGENGIQLAKGEQKQEIMREFDVRNSQLANGEWMVGWHDFCESVKEVYLNAIKKACNDDSTPMNNAVFGHYLDCEAHTDVWRELFPTYNSTNEMDI
jgi:hypothetical protein